MKALYFDSASKGKEFEARDIPADMQEEAERWRRQLLESVAELDDEVMEIYLETDDVPVDHIHRLLRQATILGVRIPTFCGASLDYVGVQPVLDGVAAYLPSPLDRPPVEGVHPNPKKQDKPQVRKPAVDEPFAGLVFKIQAGSARRSVFPSSVFRFHQNQFPRGQRTDREKGTDQPVMALAG